MANISQHLRYLLDNVGMDDNTFVDRFFRFSRLANNRKKDIPEYLSGDKEVYNATITIFTDFWRGEVNDVTNEWWSKPIDVFRGLVDKCRTRTAEASRQIAFVLASEIRPLQHWERIALPGTYRVFRYAFKNSGEFALEWLSIKESAANTFMDVRHYSVSLNDPRQDEDDNDPPVGNGDAGKAYYEEFFGRLYRIGDSYFGLLSYGDDRRVIRTRQLEFGLPAERGKKPPEWWGLLTGVGARCGFPSSCSLVAKRAERVEVSAKELLEVRYSRNEKDIPSEYHKLISNDIVSHPTWPQVDRRDFVLIAGKAIPREQNSEERRA